MKEKHGNILSSNKKVCDRTEKICYGFKRIRKVQCTVQKENMKEITETAGAMFHCWLKCLVMK